MKIKVSDFIARYLVSQGIRYNFTVTGGGAMHLNVSFGHQEGMTYIYTQHEQTAAMAAEAYYRVNNELPLVCCTTGPGGTNTLTGVLGAWLDSIPMLVISGQVKYQTTARSTGLPMRIMGDQEFDITKAAASMTKYAEMVVQPRMILYHLQKALFLATHGRPGPVWLDIPQNVQQTVVDTDDLVEMEDVERINRLPGHVSDQTLALIIEKLRSAKRPVFYAGVEIRTSGAYQAFEQVARKLNIPVVTSFDGIDILPDDDPLYAGRAGDVGNRYGNWAVQNSDVLLVVGSRLGLRQVGYTAETWARDAFVVMVHTDALELEKPGVHVELPVWSETGEFLERLSEKIEEPLRPKEAWLATCKKWKEDYPVVTVRQRRQSKENANVYCFMDVLSRKTPEDMVIVSANVSACVVGCNAFQLKKGQRFLLNCGAASMGYELPAAIGACFANGKRETFCLAGDGSVQMNIQELQTIIFHQLPIKIFLINNGGYHSIRQTQKNLFKEYTTVGIGPESGDLSFPDMRCIAEAYGIPYCAIRSNQGIDEALEQFMQTEGYALCEVFVDTEQAFEPKPSARKLPDGTLISPPLEDMAPYLPREELEKIMLVPLVDRTDG